ncbi:unnamed protein product, partial [marine sediment metagenome]
MAELGFLPVGQVATVGQVEPPALREKQESS